MLRTTKKRAPESLESAREKMIKFWEKLFEEGLAEEMGENLHFSDTHKIPMEMKNIVKKFEFEEEGIPNLKNIARYSIRKNLIKIGPLRPLIQKLPLLEMEKDILMYKCPF